MIEKIKQIEKLLSELKAELQGQQPSPPSQQQSAPQQPQQSDFENEIIGFGKFKGLTWKNVVTDKKWYAEWLIKQPLDDTSNFFEEQKTRQNNLIDLLKKYYKNEDWEQYRYEEQPAQQPQPQPQPNPEPMEELPF